MANLSEQEIEDMIGNLVEIRLHNGVLRHGELVKLSDHMLTVNTHTTEGTYLIPIGAIDTVYGIATTNKNYETNDKMVSHPPHYQSATGLEVIDVIEAFTAELKGIEAADTANVIKYICRWNHKNGLQDLKKAMWYLTHLINHIEKTEKEND